MGRECKDWSERAKREFWLVEYWDGKKCWLDVFVLKFEMRGGCDRMWMCMCIVHEGAKISKSF